MNTKLSFKYICTIFFTVVAFLVLFLTANLSPAFADNTAESYIQLSENTYTDMTISGNYVAVANLDTDTVQIFNKSTKSLLTTITSDYLLEGDLFNPTITAIYGNTIYIYCSLSSENIYKIYSFDITNPNNNKTYKEYSYSGSNKKFGNVIDIACNSTGDIYCLTYSSELSSYIMLRKFNGSEVFVASTISGGATLTENTKIAFSYSEKFLYLINNTNIYQVSLEQEMLTITNTYPTTVNFTQVSIDINDNIYILSDTGTQITKLLYNQESSSAFTSSMEITLTSSNPITTFHLDISNGDIYLLDNTSDNILLQNSATEIDNLSNNFTFPDTNNQNLKNKPIQVAKLKNDTVTYNYPYAISPNILLKQNDLVYVLDTNNNFSFCLVTDNSNFNLFIYINSKNLENVSNENVVSIKTSTIQTPVYIYPSSLYAVGTESPIKSTKIIPSGTTFTANTLTVSPTDFHGKSFYEVKFEDGTYGYIDKTDAYTTTNTNNNEEPVSPVLQTNAYVFLGNDNNYTTTLYTYENNEYVETNITIANKTKVQVDKDTYDINSPFTEIYFINSENVITKAYIKTSNIRFDGASTEIIIAIILSVVCIILTIILTVFLRKNKKKSI